MTNEREEMQGRRGVRAYRRVATALAAAAILAAPLAAQGNTRELACRGNTGMVLRVDQDPSPRDTANVVMVLEYTRSTKQLGGDPRALDPGTCTWNTLNIATFPVEPGRVRFEVRREAQPWSGTGKRMMDTTVRAAVFMPDPITLPRYLLDPAHYWKFYVNDVTNLAYSHMAMFESGLPTYVWITGPVQLANDVRRDLVCRGGTSGLLWGGGASVGNNLAKVQLTYRVSATVPGAAGRGLAAGTCAWTSRTAMPPEPGKIWFVTASNAQLKQMQSGGTIDRSPTAAERYPDVRSIPEYLNDPAHYWTFGVVSRDPDSAVTNGPWKPDLTSMVSTALSATGSRTSTATTRALPTSTVGGQTYTPGGASTTSSATSVFDIRNVTVTPGLEGVAIRFEAAANIVPTVTLQLDNGGPAIPMSVGVTPNGSMSRFSAATTTKLARNTKYAYRIDAPATANARANSSSGAFKTLGQYLTVSISQVNMLSDGDTDGNGELTFQFPSCPAGVLTDPPLGTFTTPLDWGDGPHATSVQLTSTSGNTPDRIRIVPWVFENDFILGDRARPIPKFDCSRQSGVDPGNNGVAEWNSLVMDIDLTKYPGARAGDSFVRRSKPLANGSKVSFEIRGTLLITRQ